MIKDIKSPSVEDIVAAFKARKKNAIATADAEVAEKKAKLRAYEAEQHIKTTELRDLVVRITKGLVEIGQLEIAPVNKSAFLVGCRRHGKIDISNGYSRGSSWRSDDSTVWNWHLQFDLRHHALFSWTGSDLDELTLKLCEYVGEALAWFERHPEK